MAGAPPIEDQSRLLEDALGVVRQQSAQMRRNLETPGKLMDALKCGSTLVSELRTPSLGPKQYYELYMAVFDALRHLSMYLRESHPVNHLADLYELVQYAGNIIPRLYLMITVGTVYMAVEDAPVKEIMKDMMEMSRGVQHPIRGLFLRYYLTGQARDCLPIGTEDGPQGTIQDSINFILTNFVEMNKLWVRWQHQGHSREREQRTQERRELELLVGSNLVRLSQLVDLESYKSTILAPLLEQVVQCRDVLAQEYLLEVITKVFPDEYHLHTLDKMLSAIAKLNPHVDMKKIVIGLMDRLSSYAQRELETESPETRQKAEEEATIRLLEKTRISKNTTDSSRPNGEVTEERQTNGIETANSEESDRSKDAVVNGEPRSPIKNALPDVKLYEIFYDQVVNIVRTRGLSIQDTTALLVSLVNLALNIYPDRLDYVNQILAYASQKTAEHADSPDLHSAAAQTNMLNLLLAPVKTYFSLFTALALPHYISLCSSQTYSTRRSVAREIVQLLLRDKIRITTIDQLQGILALLKVIIGEKPQRSAAIPNLQSRQRGETDETLEEQGWLARLIYLIQAVDNNTQFELLKQTREACSPIKERRKYTYPAIITSSMKLARLYKSREHLDDDWHARSGKLYVFMMQTIEMLYKPEQEVTGELVVSTDPRDFEPALRLSICCGQIAFQCGFEVEADNIFSQAFFIYEEAVADSRSQFPAVCLLIGALQQLRGLRQDIYDKLITKAALHGSRLLKKPDQCRAVYLASHLWWTVELPGREEDPKDLYRDGKRVLECLQRALRVADSCMDTSVSVELFVEILNRYLYYFDQQNESVTIKYLNGLIELIHSNLSASGHSDGPSQASLEVSKRHFLRTLEYINSREYEGVITEAR